MASRYKKEERVKVLEKLDEIKDDLNARAPLQTNTETRAIIDKIHAYYVESIESSSYSRWEIIEDEYTALVNTLVLVKNLQLTPDQALREIRSVKDQRTAYDDMSNLLNFISPIQK